MLNSNSTRELCYVVRVDDIRPIEGADRVEIAQIAGWTCMVRKGVFKPGSWGIYFETDSRVPAVEPFMFLASKDFKIKIQKYFKGTVISNGLLMAIEDFTSLENPPAWAVSLENRIKEGKDVEHEFLTDVIGVTYAVDEDNKRKANSVDKYTKMTQRKPGIFKKPWAKWMMKRTWGRKVMFALFGKKKDSSPTSFPTKFPYVRKTDEERIENIPHVLSDKRKLIASEKLDGTSSTYILERKGKKKFEFWVLSRNVRQLTPDQKCYHGDNNIYWNMAFKYNIEQHLREYLEANPELTYVCLQGESVGSVQGNPLKLSEDDFYGFNFIRSDVGRISSLEGKKILESWGMKWVPIISTEWVNPDTMEEMKTLATGKSLVNPNVLREGIVYRDENDGTFSFKNVSSEFLLKKK